jgi:hypothetical protein
MATRLRWAVEERLHLDVDLLAQAAHLAFGDAAHPHGFDQVVDRTRRYSLDVRLLDNRRQSFLCHAARFKEAREIAALAQLRDAKLDGSSSRLPIAVTVAIALSEPHRVLLAEVSTRGRADLQLHQPLGGKANHLTQ